MTEQQGLDLPPHVVGKIQKVLGIDSSTLQSQDVVGLIEELCDTALMFDREERDQASGEIGAAADHAPEVSSSVFSRPIDQDTAND